MPHRHCRKMTEETDAECRGKGGVGGAEGTLRGARGADSTEPRLGGRNGDGFAGRRDQGGVGFDLRSAELSVFCSNMSNAVAPLIEKRYAGYVDIQTPENLGVGAKAFQTEDGLTGVAVKADGDIVGVYNANLSKKGAMRYIMACAKSAGGDRLDCYGRDLVNLYAQHGFVPVSRVKFAIEYVEDDEQHRTLRENRPDVYAMMLVDGESRYYHQDELDALKLFDDYDEALAERDRQIAEHESNSSS